MNRDERLKIIERYAAEVGAFDKAAQRDSLATAQALAEEFAEGGWAIGFALPPTRSGKVPEVRPDHGPHFQKWAQSRFGLEPKRVQELGRAQSIVEKLPRAAIPEGTGEFNLRPLSTLRKDFPHLIPKVWEQAVKDAGGQAPTADQVKAAKALLVPKVEAQGIREIRTMRDEGMSMITVVRGFLHQASKDPERFASLVEEMRLIVVEDFRKQKAGEDLYPDARGRDDLAKARKRAALAKKQARSA